MSTLKVVLLINYSSEKIFFWKNKTIFQIQYSPDNTDFGESKVISETLLIGVNFSTKTSKIPVVEWCWNSELDHFCQICISPFQKKKNPFNLVTFVQKSCLFLYSKLRLLNRSYASGKCRGKIPKIHSVCKMNLLFFWNRCVYKKTNCCH